MGLAGAIMCNKDCFNDKLMCKSCIEESDVSAKAYLKRKEEYIAYKQSQEGVIGFGKYKDKDVKWLIKNDMQYAKWLLTKRNISNIYSPNKYLTQMEKIAQEIYERLECC